MGLPTRRGLVPVSPQRERTHVFVTFEEARTLTVIEITVAAGGDLSPAQLAFIDDVSARFRRPVEA